MERDLFQNIFVPAYRPWPRLFASLGLHSFFLIGVPVLMALFPIEAPRSRMPELRPLTLQIPENLPRSAEGAQGGLQAGGSPAPGGSELAAGSEKWRPAPGGRRSGSQAPVKPEPRAGTQSGGGGATEALRRFELPVLPRITVSQQTVLQEEAPPDLERLNVRLPNIAFWSAPEHLEPPPRRRFVTPGRTNPLPERPQMVAAPKLELPNREVSVTELRHAGSVLDRIAALNLPTGTTAPLRRFEPLPENTPQRPPSLDVIQGEPVNLIAFSDRPAPLSAVIQVLPGNQIAAWRAPSGEGGGQGVRSGSGADGNAAHGAGNGGAAAGGDAGGSAGAGTEGSEAGGNLTAGGVAGGSGGDGNGVGGLAGRGSGGNTSGNGGSGIGQANGSGRGGSDGSGTAGLGGAGTGAGNGRRSGFGSGSRGFGDGRSGTGVITISPEELSSNRPSPGRDRSRDGKFDVVVVQTSPADVFPEARGLLTGKPLYTVYLQVGSAKEWILQYCLPKGADSRVENNGGIVVQGNPTPLDAPYPLATFRPAGPVDNGNYIIVHGYIDAQGSLRDLRLVGSRSAIYGDHVLPALNRWQFRPALRDGQPVKVEVLLAIPPHSA